LELRDARFFLLNVYHFIFYSTGEHQKNKFYPKKKLFAFMILLLNLF